MLVRVRPRAPWLALAAWLFVVCALPPAASAQDGSALVQGQKLSGPLTVGRGLYRKQIALPQGEWTVLATASSTGNLHLKGYVAGSASPTRLLHVALGQIRDRRLHAFIYIQANVEPNLQVSHWMQPLCKGDEYLFRKILDKSVYTTQCLEIVHDARFLGDQAPFWSAVRESLAAGDAQFTPDSVQMRFQRDERRGGRLWLLYYSFPGRFESDAQKAGYVARLAQWAEEYAKKLNAGYFGRLPEGAADVAAFKP